MTDPLSFSSVSPRFALPLLFAGQSQKEVIVNEALLTADVLLHPTVEAIVTTPPAAPASGQCWLVGTSAIGAFAGKSGQIASWSDGGWRFVAPREGMRAYDIGVAAHRVFAGGTWQLAPAPVPPAGGTVIDGEARAAIGALITALRAAGVFS